MTRGDADSGKMLAGREVAVLVPVKDEERTIAEVVRKFKTAIPRCTVYVFDNCSTDDSAAIARNAGAEVSVVRLPGKGNVVRRMFADIEADCYVMVDGDDTYDPPTAPKLVEKLTEERLDMVVGCRFSEDKEAYRIGHRFGNRMLNMMVSKLFGHGFNDILSGYRAFSRRFVKSFPVLSSGFEIETELTVHALGMRMPVGEIATAYSSRAAGAASKLRTYSDGCRILITILRLFKQERPLAFFSLLASAMAMASMISAYPLFITYVETGLVPRLPTAVLATGLMLMAFLSLTCGLILETVTRGRWEAKMLSYLTVMQRVETGEHSVGHKMEASDSRRSY